MQTSNVFSEFISRITEIGHSFTKGMNSNDMDLKSLCQHLLSGRGEATGLALAHEILNRYDEFNEEGKLNFFLLLSADFGVDSELLNSAIDEWKETGNDVERNIHFASEPQSIELIRRLNRVSGATHRLVSMRSDLLDQIKKQPSKKDQLKQLDYDFRHLFASWFNRGFLELRSIDWSTPAEILERIIQYEAVHEIKGWEDLRRRVGKSNRRLYAYFHPSMKDEPLVFVEVALLERIPGAIKPILSEQDSESVDMEKLNTATFYSISNCQPGLRGISFGNFLIKQAVIEVSRELPNIKTFVTLSPVPGFRRWAESLVRNEFNDIQLDKKYQKLLMDLVNQPENDQNNLSIKTNEVALNDDLLLQILSYYFVVARSQKQKVIDPVARFHLGNGARLEQLHPSADLSDQGLKNSWGLMVNYLYDLDHIEANHEAFLNADEVVISNNVNNFLKAIK